MAHFGVICPPVPSHVRLFLALGTELQARRHRVTFFNMADVGERVGAASLGFIPLGQKDHPPGSLPVSIARMGELHGLAALRFTVNAIRNTTEMFCRDAPDAVKRAGVDLLLVDQTEPAGGAVAEHLGMPFVTVCSALAMNREPHVPPAFTTWSYGQNTIHRLRNQAGYHISDVVIAPMLRVLSDYRKRWGLRRLRRPDESSSQLAQICQQPPAFDFPRKNLPDCFHYTGPLRSSSRNPVPFPWESLNGRPLVYASFGTVLRRGFSEIAAAVAKLDAQLVIGMGGGPSQIGPLPGSPIVASFAPQEELLARAALCITHGGLNTVLESLSFGVPLVVVPVTNDQPGNAARVEWTRSGRVVPLRKLSAPRLGEAAEAVLRDQSYAEGARRVQSSIREAGGVRRAADIVEQVQFTGKAAIRTAL